MSNISMSDAELLKFAIENGMLDTALVQERIEMHKREEMLAKHPYEIYQGKDGKWYTYLPDDKKGRVKIKRNEKYQVQDKVYEYWKSLEERVTVEDIFQEWSTDKLSREEISKSTYDRYIQDFSKYFAKIRNIEVKYITEDFLEDFVKNMIHEFSMSVKCYSNCRTLIYGIFKRAKKKKLISFSVTESIKDMEISKKSFKKTIVRADEQVFLCGEKETVEKYLEENPDITNLGILLMFKTGVRIGELATFKISDVDNYTLFINRTETRYKDENGKDCFGVKDFPKSEAGVRYAIIPEKYKWILDDILRINPNGDFLFEKENGNRIRTYEFRRRLYNVCDKCKMEKRKSPHKIRKTYGTILLDGHVRESTILETMGHTDISMTKGHYYFDRTNIEEKRAELGSVEGL